MDDYIKPILDEFFEDLNNLRLINSGVVFSDDDLISEAFVRILLKQPRVNNRKLSRDLESIAFDLQILADELD